MKTLKNLLLATTLSLGCGEGHDHEDHDAEACEHLKETAVDVTATATGADAPAVNADHRAYRVRLTGGSGMVKLAVAKAGEHAIYTNAPATLSVASTTGGAVAAKSSVTSVAACTDVKGRYAFDLQVGTYVISVASAEASVTLLVEAPE